MKLLAIVAAMLYSCARFQTSTKNNLNFKDMQYGYIFAGLVYNII